MPTDIALVTGANKGIGRAIAAQLADAGYVVYVGSRDPERGRQAAGELATGQRDVRFLALDVTDQASVDAAATVIGAEFGHLDVLVNNAGIFVHGPTAPSETTAGDMARTYDTNVFGVVRVTNAVLPLLRKADAARVVNISSDVASLHDLAQGDSPVGEFPLLLAYNSSKSALNAITIAYAKELADAGIKVNVAAPGYVATDLNGHAGLLSPEQGARIPVQMATLPADGPTGTFAAADVNGGVTTRSW
jgi:NAD(P)-dependent dehydrogenase (short-subunit alcohol dehydrogenase family)